MRISARQQKKIADNVSAYFVYKKQTASLKHKVLFGLDYAQLVRPIGGARIWTSGSKAYLKKDGTVAKYNPDNRDDFILNEDGNPTPNIPHFNLESPNYTLAYPSDLYFI